MTGNPTITQNLRCLAAVLLAVLVASMVHAQSDRVFFMFNASNGLADNSAQVIKCTKTGRMVISTIGHINFYDGAFFTHIDPTVENIFPLPKYTGHYRLYFDKHHHLWLKDKNTVTCVDLLQERFIKDVGGVIRSLGMDKPVDDLFADEDCHLWFLSGTRLKGIEQGREMPVGQQAELQDVAVYDSTVHLQFFANSVVSAYDMKTSRHLYDVRALDETEAARYTKSSVVYQYQDRFFQIRNGDKQSVLLCFDMKSRRWKTLMRLDYHLNNMAINQNSLYLACEYGYWIYDLATGHAVHQNKLGLTHGRQLETDVNTIAFDRQGGMWVGTEQRGLFYSKPFKVPFNSYAWNQPEAVRLATEIDRLMPESKPLPRHVNCRITDSRGWIWTGTYSGLQVSRDKGKTHHTYTRRDGMLNEMIHSVIEDDNHNIWAATSFGISLFLIRNDSISQIETYAEHDNVPEESFVNGKAAKLDDGTIVMQSLDHVVAFNPANFRLLGKLDQRLYPKLVRLMIAGEVIGAGDTVGGRVILDRAITRARELRVNYNQNSMLLTFTGLNYTRPIQTYYRYRVVGLSDKWKVLSHSNSNGQVDRQGMLNLPLSGLRPGRYVVEMQVSTLPFEWPVEPLTWTIYVEEPWWRTTGVHLSVALLLLALLLTNVFFYNRNTRLKAFCTNEEERVMRRLRTFVNRCVGFSSDVLAPSYQDFSEEQAGVEGKLSRDFQDFIMHVYPLFENKATADSLTLERLAHVTGKRPTELAELIAANTYKSPRLLTLRIRLHKAAEQLLTTDKKVEDIASDLGFASPNFLIASFYHHYRRTPADYRNEIAR